MSHAIERIRRSKPLATEFAGDIHADAAGAEGRAWCSPLGGDRCVVAPGTEVEEVRRVIFVESDLPLVVEGDVNLGIAFIKAGAFLRDVARNACRQEGVRQVSVRIQPNYEPRMPQ